MKNNSQNIHMVGIGGTGMSGIAELLLAVGYKVSGSDIAQTGTVNRLKSLGATINIGHKSEAIKDADVVVVSSAIGSENVEIKMAQTARIPIISRAEMLGELMRFKRGVAVAGTHGKTTTTSMIASILAKADLDPTYVIGGRLNAISANAKLGQGEYLVAEADESDASFLQLQPVVAVVTNIDEDHMQTYDNSSQKLHDAFAEFLHHLPFWGVAVLCADDPGITKILPHVSRKITSFGFSEHADFRATNVRQEGAQMFFQLVIKEVSHGEIRLNLPGEHNVLNAMAAIAVTLTVIDELNVGMRAIREALAEFSGVGRRFETHLVQWQNKNLTWMDDYAHHPKEMIVTWHAAKGCWPDQRILLIVQPHRYSRIQHLFDEFVQALSQVTPDILLLMDVYEAGEKHIEGADSQALGTALRTLAVNNVVGVKDEHALQETLSRIVKDDDVVISMGAGSISMWVKNIFEATS